MNPTNIEWLLPEYNGGRKGFTWNPVVGCTPISPGCANCYAERLHTMRHKAYLVGKKLPHCYAKPFSAVRLLLDRLDQPTRRRSSSTIFVCSMSDLFHERCGTDWIYHVMRSIRIAQQHTYVVLTKRAERMLVYLRPTTIASLNVALGVSVSTQAEWDEKVPLLLKCPARWRFVSIEPMLEGIDVRSHVTDLDGIILGGESGPNARPTDIRWVRPIRQECEWARVPFFFKQIVVCGRMRKMPHVAGVQCTVVPWGDA